MGGDASKGTPETAGAKDDSPGPNKLSGRM